MAIYVITRVTGTTEAGSRLTDKEMEEIRAKRDALCASVGGKAVAAYKSYTGRGNRRDLLVPFSGGRRDGPHGAVDPLGPEPQSATGPMSRTSCTRCR